jgi:simple sugar transport system ATP-binding protein
MQGIVKFFGKFCANDHVNLTVAEGEIHALLGENGAGKTTLMNILYGLYQPDEGQIYIRERLIRVDSPGDAIGMGVGMVHQHFMLIPAFSVAENIILGMDRGILLNISEAGEEIRRLSAEYGLDVDPLVKVWQLAIGQQQKVEIIKALFRKAKILILDEPTAVLSPQEVDDLFRVLRRLTKEGMTVIFISHKLHEVMSICDRVTVLRQGKNVATVATKDTTREKLAQLMVGRELKDSLSRTSTCTGDPILKVSNAACLNDKWLTGLKNINITVCAGEIVGIAGVDGNGQTELIEVITGLRKITGGRIEILGCDVAGKTPRERLCLGIGHIPVDRQRFGLVKEMSLTENMILQTYFQEPYCNRNGIINWKKARDVTDQLITEYDVRAGSLEQLAGSLSGGMQQKVVLAREMSRNPKFLIAAHPTRGLDVGATEYIHTRLVEQRNAGMGILLVSTELEEIIALSDRIAVMFNGEIVGMLGKEEIDVRRIGLLMAGAKESLAGQQVCHWEYMCAGRAVSPDAAEEAASMNQELNKGVTAWIENNQAAFISFLVDLVRIPSESGQEGPVAGRIKQEMLRLGYDEVCNDRLGNMIGRIGSGHPAMLWDAHMDIVPAGDPADWGFDPFEGKIENGALYGRGACDDKGPLAAMVIAGAQAKQYLQPGRGSLYVVGAVGEEIGEGMAISEFIKGSGVEFDYAVICEASALSLCRGHKGRCQLEIGIPGRGGHASAPELADNPLYKAARIVLEIQQLNERLPIHEVLGRGTIAATQLTTKSNSINSIAEGCKIFVDRRLTMGETAEVVIRQLEEICRPYQATVELMSIKEQTYTGAIQSGEEFFAPWFMDEQEDLVQAGARALKAATGGALIRTWQFSTDGAQTRGAFGISTIGIGPGDERYPHSVHDQINLQEYLKAIEVYALLAHEVLGK